MNKLFQRVYGATDVSGISRWSYSILGLLGTIALVWLFTAQLASAVIMSGSVKVYMNRLMLQHPEGGRIHAVQVVEGAVLQAGDQVLTLENPQLASLVRSLERQLFSERLRVHRLRAELLYPDGEFVIDYSGEDEERLAIAQTELNLYEARRRNLRSQELLLSEQVEHSRGEIIALEQSLVNDHAILERTRELADQGFVSALNVLTTEQTLNQRQAELSRARQRVAELEQRMPVLLEDFRNNAATELRLANERILDAEERLRPAREAFENLIVRAPVTGTVVNLTRLGPGAVLGSRETIAEIVPADRGLIIEGSLATEQVAFLTPGMPARIRIAQFSRVGYDELLGRLETISADTITQGMLGTSAYLVQVSMDELPPDIEYLLRPGMPVEIYIQTGTRTPFQYLTEPVTAFFKRAARE